MVKDGSNSNFNFNSNSFLESESFGGGRVIPKTDLEMTTQERLEMQKEEENIHQFLTEMLAHSEQLLDRLESPPPPPPDNDNNNNNDDTTSTSSTTTQLGPAIRKCALDLATLVGNVARDLGPQEEEEGGGEQTRRRREWARATLQDAKAQLLLEQQEYQQQEEHQQQQQHNDQQTIINTIQHGGANQRTTTTTMMNKTAAEQITNLTEENIMDALSTAQTLLFDIEESLRSISVEEADEIADVGLVVSRMFLWSLKSLLDDQYDDVLEQRRRMGEEEEEEEDIMDHGTSTNYYGGMDIQIIHDDDDDDEHNNNGTDNTKSNQTSSTNQQQKQKQRQRTRKAKQKRMRILWPPIGKSLSKHLSSTFQQSTIQKQILSIAIAMSLWPVLLITAFLTPSILITDWVLQSTYGLLEQEQPDLIRSVEEGVANLYQVGKLYILLSKLVVKKSLRIGCKQIERRGGIGQVVQDGLSWSVDRMVHPVETVQQTIEGVKWSMGIIGDSIQFVKDHVVGVGSSDCGEKNSSAEEEVQENVVGVDGNAPISMML